jgi:phosphoribosylanthranilate isomerase
MKDKINEFLRITKELNKIHIFPVMYGSLGLYFLLNKNGKDIMDIDIVVPRIFTDSKLVKIVEVMSKFGYKQDKIFIQEFESSDHRVGFESEDIFSKDVNKKIEELNLVNIDGVKFRTLNKKDYRTLYKKTLKIWKNKINKIETKLKLLD